MQGAANDELLERVRFNPDDFSNALAERIFSMGRYLIWAASRPGAMPSHLQGAWNGDYAPPWMCGYTQDENVQVHYWQVLAGGMPEATEAYFNYIERQRPDWRENARKIHGLDGVLATINASRTGLQFHAGENWPWDWYTGAAGWLAQLHWDHYLYTGDRDFLKRTTVPLLKEIVTFYEGYCSRDEAGRWSCIPSISPENIPIGHSHRICGTTTMDVAIAKEVYTHLIHACEILNLDEPESPRWRETLKSLPEYKINEDGAVKEWMDETVEDNYHHRHQSHIYPVFPGWEVNRDRHADLLDAFATAVDKRLVVGLEDQVGWSLSHMAGIFARLGQAERAYQCLRQLASRFLEINLFSYCNPGYIAMQLDGTLGAAGAMQEMLLQSYPLEDLFVVHVLPALPAAWADGSFRGLRTRGGAEVSAKWRNSRLVKLEIKATRDVCLLIRSEATEQRVDLTAGGCIEFGELPVEANDVS